MPLSSKDQSDLLAFGEYSQRFSFKVGSGLPGRVYSSGVASWEQGISSAPQNHFERGGGAKQWGIETALGLCISCPSGDRVVVILYSLHDRPRDEQLMLRLSEELKRLMPIPRWKLVVDVGADASFDINSSTDESELRELLEKLWNNQEGGLVPSNMAGFYPLLQLLRKDARSETEKELVAFVVSSYGTFKRQGRPDTEIAWMTCRDFSVKEPELRKRENAVSDTSAIPHQDLSSKSDCGQAKYTGQGSCCPPKSSANSNGYIPPHGTTNGGCCPSSQNNSNGCCPQPTSVDNPYIPGSTCGSQNSTNAPCCPPQQVALQSNDHEPNQIPELTITTMHSAIANNGQNGYPSGDSRSTENLMLPGQLESLIFDSNGVGGEEIAGGNIQMEGVSANHLAELFRF